MCGSGASATVCLLSFGPSCHAQSRLQSFEAKPRGTNILKILSLTDFAERWFAHAIKAEPLDLHTMEAGHLSSNIAWSILRYGCDRQDGVNNTTMDHGPMSSLQPAYCARDSCWYIDWFDTQVFAHESAGVFPCQPLTTGCLLIGRSANFKLSDRVVLSDFWSNFNSAGLLCTFWLLCRT
jgi:hypothetical protein